MFYKKILILIILFLFSSCQDDGPAHKISSANTSGQKNIILIVSDALRADVLGCYGGQAKTPYIDWLADNGVLFEKAYTPAPFTMAASVALFTGENPGVFKKGVFPGKKMWPRYFVPDKKLLLMEKLQEDGYDLRKSLENKVFQSFKCTDEFNKFKEFNQIPTKNIKYIKKITGTKEKINYYKNTYEILNYLINTTGTRPFFIVNWILDPHTPYCPPDYLMDQISVDRDQLTKKLSFYIDNVFLGTKSVKNFNDHEKRFLKDLYIKEVEAVDERVGAIIQVLKSRNLFENTYIILTSDHGEAFGEHGHWGHGRNYFDTLVHIPLVVSGPGIQKGKREQVVPVSLIDVMPTLKELLGLDYADNSQGKSFVPSLTTDSSGSRLSADVSDKDIYLASGSDRQDDRNKYREALLSGCYKLVVTYDDEHELYDLSKDPGELYDISAENPVMIKTMLDKIAVIKKDIAKRKEEYFPRKKMHKKMQNVDDKTLNSLKALGYIQ